MALADELGRVAAWPGGRLPLDAALLACALTVWLLPAGLLAAGLDAAGLAALADVPEPGVLRSGPDSAGFGAEP